MAETIGSLADKITIIELKRYHMGEQVERDDVSDAQRLACGRKLAILDEQRDDLIAELNALFGDALAGRVECKVYRQFKMYNDPQYRPAQVTKSGTP